jgi:hypothetical protein
MNDFASRRFKPKTIGHFSLSLGGSEYAFIFSAKPSHTYFRFILRINDLTAFE